MSKNIHIVRTRKIVEEPAKDRTKGKHKEKIGKYVKIGNYLLMRSGSYYRVKRPWVKGTLFVSAVRLSVWRYTGVWTNEEINAAMDAIVEHRDK